MRLRLLVLAILASVGLVAVPTSAHAATNWYYSGSTGATYIRALGNVVESDLTASSGVSGGPSRTSTNSMAAANVGALVSVGAVETKTIGTNTDGNGSSIRSYSRIAGVNVLNGLIKIDAVTTDITSKASSAGAFSFTGGTQLAGIKIAGVKLPLNIPKNYGVNIPGVAAISLNWVNQGTKDGLTATLGWGVAVQLLKSTSGFDAGTTIVLAPVNHYFTEAKPGGSAPGLGGFAYATRIQVDATSQIRIKSDPTAITYTPYGGSNGETRRTTTATLNLTGLLTTNAITTTSTSSSEPNGDATVTNTSQFAKLNLLGGLIKADAIKISATGTRKNGVWTHSEDMSLLNLVIAGQSIPLNVSPNTVIDVLGLGKVEINKRQSLASQQINRIDALRITLNTEKAGLPVGAVIELGVAGTQIYIQ